VIIQLARLARWAMIGIATPALRKVYARSLERDPVLNTIRRYIQLKYGRNNKPQEQTLIVRAPPERPRLPPGVSYCPQNTNRTYRARIQRHGQRIELGYFATVDEAAAAYRRAKH
jgi:hypothetical protein